MCGRECRWSLAIQTIVFDRGQASKMHFLGYLVCVKDLTFIQEFKVVYWTKMFTFISPVLEPMIPTSVELGKDKSYLKK